MNMNITPAEVKCETRAIRATWSREMAKDLSLHHGVDSSELERAFRREIIKEKRKKSINKIFQKLET